MSVKDINVAKMADAYLASIEDGFNGVSVGELERECCWHEQYAIFLLGWDTLDLTDGDTEYNIFDWDKFNSDVEIHMKNAFPGCNIRVSCQGREFEIVGPKYKEFYAKHRDRLEELECTLKKSCHWVYHPEKAGEAQMEKRKTQI